MKKILFIVCSNGYGHLMRCKKIIEQLSNYNFIKISVILKKDHLKVLNKNSLFISLYNEGKIEIIDCGTNLELKKKSDSQKLIIGDFNFLNNRVVKEADIVISDINYSLNL